MADVIRAALDAHPAWWWTPNGISTEVRCTGPDCDWTASAVGVQPRDSHRAHQAEVGTAAVLKITERVLVEHAPEAIARFSYDAPVRLSLGCASGHCTWEATTPSGADPGPYAEHVQQAIAAALARED